jgi:hypothetical protein
MSDKPFCVLCNNEILTFDPNYFKMLFNPFIFCPVCGEKINWEKIDKLYDAYKQTVENEKNKHLEEDLKRWRKQTRY